MEQTSSDNQNLLRRSLVGNALFSIFSALIIFTGGGWLARLLGLHERLGLTVVGLGLVAYAVILLTNARRPKINLGDAWTAVILDTAWVGASYALIFIVPFTFEGKWLIAIVAEVVLGFAVLQVFGIRRIANEPPAQPPALQSG